jgi:hypothetical protein
MNKPVTWQNLEEAWDFIDGFGIVRLQVFSDENRRWKAVAEVQDVRGFHHHPIISGVASKRAAIETAERWLEGKRV